MGIVLKKNEIPDQLVLDIVNGKVVPFIGAGFSRSFGYLGWIDLLKELSHKVGIKDLVYEDIENGDPLQIAQAFYHFYKEKNRSQVLDNLKKQVEMNSAEKNKEILWHIENAINREVDRLLEKKFSQKMLNLIVSREESTDRDAILKLEKINEIPFHYLITTNYDNVLENIYSEKDYGVLYPGKGQELDWNEHDKTILKIHGDVNSDEGVVFTHEQYYKFMHDYGFFRNKLYTLFSSNTILMMGYGFNDINIHHTYFQFIRDYSDSLGSHKKMYMLLTDFDRERKWKSYFQYYKRYLESYNVQVIEYTDLPSFVEDLVRAYIEEKHSSSIKRLLNVQGNNLTEPLKLIIQGDSIAEKEYKDNGLNIIKAITKFFRNPFILTEKPFSLSINEDGIEFKLAKKLFNSVESIINVHKNYLEKEDYFVFVNEILEYTSKTSDWTDIYLRIKYLLDFMGKLEYKTENDYDTKTGQEVYRILSQCHPSKYLYAFDAGQHIQSNLNLIPPYYLYSYLWFLKDFIIEDELISYPLVHDFWVQQIKERFQHKSELSSLCQDIDEIIRSNQSKFHDF